MTAQGIGLLVVDDEPNIRTSLGSFLEHRGYQVRTAGRSDEALRQMEDGQVRIALVDLRIADTDGIELAQKLLAAHPGTVVLIMTAYSTVESAVTAMRSGVYDYLTKPVEPEELLTKLGHIVERMHLSEQLSELRERLGQTDDLGLVGRSGAMRRVRELVRAAARSDLPVLICGETGTGKELVARAIHDTSAPKSPFVALNCTAMPESLMESELFGHVRGAFTGAVRTRAGRIASAAGGVLFLDEIGASPLPLQAKLLRVLQERVYMQVGGDKEESVAARIIAAMNQDPKELIAAGRMREDLYYRIGIFRIDVPSLRQRLEDLPVLVEALLARIAHRANRALPRVSPELMAGFYAYGWPGNVRELENLLSAMLALEHGDLLTQQSLPPDYRHLASGAREGGPASLSERMEQFERHILTEALRRNDAKLLESAKELGIDERSLRRKLIRLGIDREALRAKR